jgi:hypothetical protein
MIIIMSDPVEPPIATPETLMDSITARSSLGLETSTLSLIHEYSRSLWKTQVSR